MKIQAKCKECIAQSFDSKSKAGLKESDPDKRGEDEKEPRVKTLPGRQKARLPFLVRFDGRKQPGGYLVIKAKILDCPANKDPQACRWHPDSFQPVY